MIRTRNCSFSVGETFGGGDFARPSASSSAITRLSIPQPLSVKMCVHYLVQEDKKASREGKNVTLTTAKNQDERKSQ